MAGHPRSPPLPIRRYNWDSISFEQISVSLNATSPLVCVTGLCTVSADSHAGLEAIDYRVCIGPVPLVPGCAVFGAASALWTGSHVGFL